LNEKHVYVALPTVCALFISALLLKTTARTNVVRSRAPPSLFPHPCIWLRVRSPSRRNVSRKPAVFSCTGMRYKLKGESPCGMRGKWNECPWHDKLDACILVLFIYIRVTVKDVPQLRLRTGLLPKCACFDLTAVTGRIHYYLWHIHCAVSKLPGWYFRCIDS
jgi:hypothetical protein